MSGEQAEERTAREGREERLWFCEDCGRRRRMPVGFPPVATCRGGHKNWQLCMVDDDGLGHLLTDDDKFLTTAIYDLFGAVDPNEKRKLIALANRINDEWRNI